MIQFDKSVFKKLGKSSELKPGKPKKDFFTIGTKTKHDYLIYNNKTGDLTYDADVSSKGKAVEFAQVQKNLKLTEKDLLII